MAKRTMTWQRIGTNAARFTCTICRWKVEVDTLCAWNVEPGQSSPPWLDRERFREVSEVFDKHVCAEHPPVIKDTDELAQAIVNAWDTNVKAVNAEYLTPEFKSLLEKTCAYREARRVADNSRNHGTDTVEEVREEFETLRAFVKAVSAFLDAHSKDSPAGLLLPFLYLTL